MKKLLFATVATLSSVAALAQTPATSAARADKAAFGHRPAEFKRNDQDVPVAPTTAPVNHGQTVRTVAQGTTLTGADKGAAVSAVASAGRTQRTARSARGNRTHDARPTTNGHANGHGGNNGRHAGH